MTETQNIPWKRLSVEAAAIVASILLAFAIDAWWANERDKRLERDALVSLSEELTEISERIAGLRNRDSSVINKASKFINMPANGLDGISSEDMRGLFESVPYELRLRTYDELLNTGRLNLITDRQLRLLLMDFDARAKSVLGYEDQLITQWNETARPVLYRSISFSPRSDVVGDSRNRESSLTIDDLNDSEIAELRNIIVDRANFISVHRQLITSLEELVLEIQGRVDSQLSE